jgi:hypothetical protein
VKLIRSLVKWIGILTMLFGAITILWALWVIVQYKTGWGLTAFEAADSKDWARIALSLLLSGMFFFLVGSGIVLIARYEVGATRDPDAPPPRWTKPVAVLLFICGSGSIVLATVFAQMRDEFGEATVGIVSYCMLIGVGMLFSGWGLKRAGEREQKPEPW